jgi:hypothetical protein
MWTQIVTFALKKSVSLFFFKKKNVVQSNTWELRLRQRHLEVGFINSDKMEERKIKPTHHATPK